MAVRYASGTKVAVMTSYVTSPETGVLPCFKVKVTLVSVKGAIASLKMAVIALLMDTSMAVFAGLVELTVGGVMS